MSTHTDCATCPLSMDQEKGREGNTLKALNSIAKRPPVNILFEDIEYTVRTYGERRRILHDMSGEFRSGELTCILGPSGAGKSSLLHILTGYAQNGVKGLIKINGHKRDMRTFKKLNCYIMHDDVLQPRLTALESMRIAADLKLGADITKANKKVIVTEILQTLGLWKQRHTMCERLSGGETKRLSIALELVNNPPVIFLDEPTSGLDVVSVRQLILLLRLLSRQGRTIIVTIHQPSASLFNLFDNAYVICEGQCCYQGEPSQLVPFLAEAQYICPPSHNPADFIIETLTGETTAKKQMSELCQNGKLSRWPNDTDTIQLRTYEESAKAEYVEQINKDKSLNLEFPTSFSTQFLILMKRIYLQSKRKQLNWIIQFVQYIICGFFIGGIFYMVGDEGSTPMANIKFYLCVVVFLIYTYTMVPILLLPMEIRIIRREYFNRWYGLKAYYAALTCSTIPPAIFFGMIFITMTYSMSGQLFEWDRFFLFSIIGLLTGFCSEGLGLAIGSIFDATNGAILGPSIISPLYVLCSYGMGSGSYIAPGMKFLRSLSYLRYGITGLTLPLYQNRTRMHCSEDVCLYADPSVLLREVGMEEATYTAQILGLSAFILLFRALAYFTLRHRLSNEYTYKII